MPNNSECQIRRRLLLSISGMVLLPGQAQSACLPGDLSPECIGVYKVPMDNAILPYVGTEKDLKKYAPGVKYVPPVKGPQSYKDALDILEAQRLAADDIRSVVASGKLEEAGIKVLSLLAKLTPAGSLVINSMPAPADSIGEIQLIKAKDALEELGGIWGEIDVMIGQGIRGSFGVSAVAQLQIMKEIDEAIRSYDDFLVFARKRQ